MSKIKVGDNTTRKNVGRLMLKNAAIIAVLLGFIVVFGAFFVMQQSMLPDYEAGKEQEQLIISRNISIGAMYVMVFGIINCIAGFFGAMNSDNDDETRKCIIYGAVLVVLCVANAVILAIIGDITKPLSLGMILVPVFIDGAYLAGALLKK